MLENSMLAVILFVSSFSFYYWLFDCSPRTTHASVQDNPTAPGNTIRAGNHSQEKRTPIEQQCKEVFQEIYSEGNVRSTTPHAFYKEDGSRKGETTHDTLALDAVNVDALTLRQARKIASALNIRQKVNGKDQPKQWLIAQIGKALSERPQETITVIHKVRAS